MERTPEGLPRRPLYLYDLPKDILDTLEQSQIDAIAQSEPIEDISTPSPQPEIPSTLDGKPQKTISCALCGITLSNVQEQRSHVRSDFHSFNMRQKLRGNKSVNEAEFEKLVDDLDESLSGSESSNSDEDSSEDDFATSKQPTDKLSALLEKTAHISGHNDGEFSTKRKKRGAGKPPIIWFKSSSLPSYASLGVYRAILTADDQRDPEKLVEVLRNKQLSPKPTPKLLEGGGVALPTTNLGPHVFLCMIGGGHFAAMIVSLAPKISKKGGVEERQASVIAHKTFHRYTTRRKQGGAQSANDNAKGNAHSAGSSLRRYNEEALIKEVRDLLTEWKPLIDSSELLFIRATGSTNRRTLFGPYDGQVLRHDDARNRGFPFSTRRATQAELMRCFVELTRVKVSSVDEAALAAERAAEAQKAEERAEKRREAKPIAPAAPQISPEEEALLLHTSQIEALVRRTKAPALLSYLTTNDLSPDFPLHPPDSHAHAPTALHLAASINAPALVSALLLKSSADPSIRNPAGKTPFELAGDRATRDAFRMARAELGEDARDWVGARVPDALTKSEVEGRATREKEEEAARRKDELERLRAEEQRAAAQKELAGDERRAKKHGRGFTTGAATVMTAEQRRAEDAKGLTPEMKARLERERRARAAEERMKKLSG